MSTINIEVSARHCHLNHEHIEKLFGKGYDLTPKRALSQPGEFAAKEEITIRGKKGDMKVRVVGPARTRSQVELSVSDCFSVGVKPVLKLSGDTDNTPGILMIGPKGKVKLAKGVLVAKRHIHLNNEQARKMGLRNKQKVSVKINGERSATLHSVIVRTKKTFDMALHLDTDEANSVLWKPGMRGKILK